MDQHLQASILLTLDPSLSFSEFSNLKKIYKVIVISMLLI